MLIKKKVTLLSVLFYWRIYHLHDSNRSKNSAPFMYSLRQLHILNTAMSFCTSVFTEPNSQTKTNLTQNLLSKSSTTDLSNDIIVHPDRTILFSSLLIPKYHQLTRVILRRILRLVDGYNEYLRW